MTEFKSRTVFRPFSVKNKMTNLEFGTKPKKDLKAGNIRWFFGCSHRKVSLVRCSSFLAFFYEAIIQAMNLLRTRQSYSDGSREEATKCTFLCKIFAKVMLGISKTESSALVGGRKSNLWKSTEVAKNRHVIERQRKRAIGCIFNSFYEAMLVLYYIEYSLRDDASRQLWGLAVFDNPLRCEY